MHSPLRLWLNAYRHLFTRIKTNKLSLQTVTVVLTVWFMTAYNIPFAIVIWDALGEVSFLLLCLFALMLISLALLIFILLSLLSFRKVFKPSVAILFIISTVLLYSNATGKQYNPFAFSIEDWLAGAGRFVSIDFLGTLIALGLLPTILLMSINIDWGVTKKRWRRISISMCITVAVFASVYISTERHVQPIYEATRGSLSRAIPIHFLDSNIKYISKQYFSPVYAFSIIDTDPTILPMANHKTVVFMISESVRADVFAMSVGNTLLASFAQTTNVTSCSTYSNAALQCLFSFLPTSSFVESQASHQQNVLDILSLAGVNIYWLSNQSPCGELCARAKVKDVSLRGSLDIPS